MTYEQALEHYMHGNCTYFAAALHHYFDLPIMAGTYTVNGRMGLYHAWSTLPDGKDIDIQGTQSRKEITRYIGDIPEATYDVFPISLDRLAELSGKCLARNNPEISKAREAILSLAKDMGIDVWRVEDMHSGKGHDFIGNFDSACREATSLCKNDLSVWCVWGENKRVAECTMRGVRWQSSHI